MKRITICLLLLLLTVSVWGAFPGDIVTDRAQMFTLGVYDPFYKWVLATEALVDATAGTATASKALILDSDSLIDTINVGTTGISFLESSGAFTTTIKGGDQSGDLVLTLPTAYATPDYFLQSDGAGVLSWGAAGSGTFTGGPISGDITIADTKRILSALVATDYAAIEVYDTSVGYINVLKWTNAATPEVLLGHADASFALASTGVDISTAGAVTGVTDLTASGTVTTDILTATGVITLGNNTAALSIASTGLDVSTAGALSNVTDITMTGDVFMSDGQGIKSSVTTAHSVGIYGYDTNGSGYVGALVVTNSDTPATVLGNTDGTTAISSSDWTISTAGNMANIGTIGSDGLYTGTGGMTLSGTVSINDTATGSTTSIGGGTTTGTVTIGGSATQAIDIGNGAGIKTVALGSNTSSSTTTILGGSGGVNINVGTYNDPTNINTGTNTGTVTIGGIGAMTIAIGDGGTGDKTVSLGDAVGASSLTLNAGTGDMTLTSVNDITINGGSSGSIITIGGNAHGNVISIGTDNSAADTITIGSALDTSALAGILVTVGTTGSTSAVVIQSGSGEIKLNESVNEAVSIGTGTSTGTVTIGGSAAQTITIGNGAGIKAVNIGSVNTSSITTILGGSLGVNIAHGAYDDPVNIAGSTSTGVVTIGGTGTQTINLGNGGGIKTVNLGSITSSSATVISSGTGDLDIIATAILDIDVGTTMDILVAGAFSIDGANASSNISLTADGDEDDFTIALLGTHDSSLIFASAGTGTDALKISTSNAAGDIDIDSADDLTIDTVGLMAVTVGGTMTVTPTGEYLINATLGVTVDSADETADAISFNASGSAGGITFNAGSAGMTFSDDAISNVGTLSCDEISDDGNSEITYQVKTRTITIGETGGSGENFQWGAGAGHAAQNIDLGAIVPAYARVLDVTVICTETVAGGSQTDFPIKAGNQSGGTEFFTAVDLVTADSAAAGAAAGASFVAINTSISNVWLNCDPADGVWNSMTAGIHSVIVTYIDTGAASDN